MKKDANKDESTCKRTNIKAGQVTEVVRKAYCGTGRNQKNSAILWPEIASYNKKGVPQTKFVQENSTNLAFSSLRNWKFIVTESVEQHQSYSSFFIKESIEGTRAELNCNFEAPFHLNSINQTESNLAQRLQWPKPRASLYCTRHRVSYATFSAMTLSHDDHHRSALS